MVCLWARTDIIDRLDEHQKWLNNHTDPLIHQEWANTIRDIEDGIFSSPHPPPVVCPAYGAV